MSKRNFILLIIVLVILTGFGLFYFFSYKQTGSSPVSSGTNFLSEFFPFGKSTVVTPPTENPIDISGYVPPTTEEVSKNKLKKISNIQIAGFGVFMKERFKDVPVVAAPVVIENATEKTNTKTKTKIVTPPTEFVPAIRYIEKATGNIYQTFADKIEERKITVNIIPQVHEAYFGNRGESVLVRYLTEATKIIETFVGSLPKEILGGDSSANNQITGTFLPDNITDLSFSPDTLKIFYLFNTNNTAVGVTSDYLGNKKTQIFNSPFTEWLSFWPNNKMITLTTKPSNNVGGYMYSIDPSRKDFTKILSNINGLTTLTSPSGKLVLFSDNTLSLNIYNIEKREYTPTGIKTMSEKCVWNNTSTAIYCAVPKNTNGGNYPDSWYMGETSFNDKIWKIDGVTGNGTLITDPSLLTDGEEMDAVKLSIDDGENYLFFLNKKNSYLWELSLK